MKTVVISGASSGIGAELAQHFSRNSWSVLMIARSENKLKSLAEKYENVDVLVWDLSEPRDGLGNAIRDKVSKIDAVVNNAGIYRPQAIDATDEEAWLEQFQTNLMGSVRLTRAVWEPLKESKGSILNISSTLGIRPIPNTAAYSASKAAMNNWTLSLAIEGAPFGINANAICPGIVDTPIHGYFNSDSAKDKLLHEQLQKAQPLGRTGKTTDIAGMAYQLCQDESRWTTGALINIDGGILLNS